MESPKRHPDWINSVNWTGYSDLLARGLDLQCVSYAIHVFRSDGRGWHWGHLKQDEEGQWWPRYRYGRVWRIISEEDALFLLGLSREEALEQLRSVYGKPDLTP